MAPLRLVFSVAAAALSVQPKFPPAEAHRVSRDLTNVLGGEELEEGRLGRGSSRKLFAAHEHASAADASSAIDVHDGEFDKRPWQDAESENGWERIGLEHRQGGDDALLQTQINPESLSPALDAPKVNGQVTEVFHKEGSHRGREEPAMPVSSEETTSTIQKKASTKKVQRHTDQQGFDDLGADKSWIKGVVGSSRRAEPLTRQGLNIQHDDEVYGQAFDTIPGIGFLGSGYDLVMGNPLGDEHSPGDPGFRAPVIAFDWGHDKEGVSPDLTTLQPKGGYVRPFVSCQQAEAVEEVENLSDYVADLTADATTDGAALPYLPFSGSFNFRQMAEESHRKQTKTFMLRAYCLRYEAGFAAVGMNSSRTTESFRTAVETLPANFPNTADETGCTPKAFKKNDESPACRDPAILRWMAFFKDFGTHVTTNIKLGSAWYQGSVDSMLPYPHKSRPRSGKVTKQIRVSKERAHDLFSKSHTGNAAIFEFLAKANAERNAEKTDNKDSFGIATTTFAVGGRTPHDPSDPQELAEWADSVAALPMPVKYELQPLSRLLPDNLGTAYHRAQTFYSEVYGLSRADLEAAASSTTPLTQVLQDSTAVAWAGPAPGFADCPRGKRVLFGFAAYMNMDASAPPLAIKPCQTGRMDARRPEATVGCTEGKEIFFGLQMSFFFNRSGLANVTVAHCSSALVLLVPRRQTYVFLPAISSRCSCGKPCLLISFWCLQGNPTVPKCICWEWLAGLQNLFAASSAGVVGMSQRVEASKTAATDCGPNASHVAGFAMEVHTVMPLVREALNICPPTKRYCALKKVVLPPSAAADVQAGLKPKALRYSSVAFAICSLKVAGEAQVTATGSQTAGAEKAASADAQQPARGQANGGLKLSATRPSTVKWRSETDATRIRRYLDSTA
ncbi:hypothetical protein Efla_005099 [Eimeria flavescens]